MTGDADDAPRTAVAMAAALADGSVTSRELTERALADAERWQPVTNAFSQIWADEALAAADGVDRAGPDEGHPLAGVPLGVKDLFDVAGHETTSCCAAYAGRVAAGDAPTIARVRAAGLVMVGKMNQHELAAGGTNLVSACGATRNPWDPARMTGGSSGGSAAAVAAGVLPWTLGSDTGGSIRIPSSFCGTVGLKPTTGALPLDGLLPLAPSLDTPGPIASTVEDAWLLFAVMAGLSLRHPVRDWLLRRPDEPFRIGIPAPFMLETLHPELAAAVDDVATVLASAGMKVEPVDGSGLEDARKTWSAVCFPEFAEAHPDLRDRDRRALVAPSVADWMEQGERMTEEQRVRAVRRREEIGRWFRERLALMDALLIPTTPYPAPRADQDVVQLTDDVTVEVAEVGPGFLTCSVNLAGLPAINLPARRTPEGLPIGASLVGGDGGEQTISRIAMRWESVSGYAPVFPELPAAPG